VEDALLGLELACITEAGHARRYAPALTQRLPLRMEFSRERLEPRVVDAVRRIEDSQRIDAAGKVEIAIRTPHRQERVVTAHQAPVQPAHERGPVAQRIRIAA